MVRLFGAVLLFATSVLTSSSVTANIPNPSSHDDGIKFYLTQGESLPKPITKAEACSYRGERVVLASAKHTCARAVLTPSALHRLAGELAGVE